MPYIPKDTDRRPALRNGFPAENAGELNYQIFYYLKHQKDDRDVIEATVRKYIKQFLGDKPNYQKYNDMTGCLLRCAKELHRRHELFYKDFLVRIMESYDDEIAKYEDTKIESNGDVE
jgi:hypothetical protein